MTVTKFKTFFLAFLCLLFAANAFGAAVEGIDYEVSETTVTIKTAEGLFDIANIGGTTFTLDNDIELSSETQDKNCATNWTPATLPAGATFDGADHTISGVCINSSTDTYVYLMELSSGATIRNVNFSNIYLNNSNLLSENNVSIFKTNIGTSAINITDLKIYNVTIESSVGEYDGYVGLLLSNTLSSNANNRMPNITGIHAENIIINSNSTSSANLFYVGGFVGASVHPTGIPNYGPTLSDSYFKGQISATTAGKLYVSGLANGINGQYSGKGLYTADHDTVEATITGSATQIIMAGLFEDPKQLSNSKFTGLLTANTNGSITNNNYVGGATSHQTGLEQSGVITNVTVSAPEGYNDELIHVNGIGYWKVGGITGLAGSSIHISFNNCTVLGKIIAEEGNNNNYSIGGIAGASSDVENSIFIGSIEIPSSNAYVNGLVSGTSTGYTVSNSYVIDFSGNASSLKIATGAYHYQNYQKIGVASSFTDKASVFLASKEINTVSANTPEFAYYVGMTYSPSKDFVTPPAAGEQPTHRLLAIYASDTLYEVYTDPTGKIAYKFDGSPYTAEDYAAISWPNSTLQSEWALDLNAIYTEDAEHVELISETEYVLNETTCEVTLTGPSALMNLNKIPKGTCESVTYKLGADIDFGSTGTSSCRSNWVHGNAKITTELDGAGYTISGICYADNNIDTLYLFDLTEGGTVKNLNFSNIYLEHNNHIAYALNVRAPANYTSIFKTATATSITETAAAEIVLTNLQFDNVSIKTFYTYSGYTGLLFSSVGNSVVVSDVSAKNIDIGASTEGYTGGFAGYFANNGSLVFKKSSFKGNISGSKQSYMGGLVSSIETNNILLETDTVEANITSSAPYTGGFGGSFSSEQSAIFKDLIFKGKITSTNGDGGRSMYLGGFAAYGYSSNTMEFENLQISSNEGPEGTILKIADDYKSSHYNYVGGIFGSQFGGTIKINKATVMGGINLETSLPSSYANTYAAGFFGKLQSSSEINNSLFYGSLPPTSAKAGITTSYAFIDNIANSSTTTSTITSSYAIDLNDNATALAPNLSSTEFVALGHSISEFIDIKTNDETVVQSKPTFAIFAHAMGMALPTNGYAIPPTDGNRATHRLTGIYKDEVLFEVYTDASGKIAFTSDGETQSPFTAADLAEIEYPDNWPDDKKISLSKVYEEDMDYELAFDDGDYLVDGCDIYLYTKNALLNFNKLPLPTGCSDGITFKLGNDIAFSTATQTTTCATNWNKVSLPASSSFDGTNYITGGHYKISGVCYNSNVEDYVFLFDLSDAKSFKNVDFENIYLKNTKTTSITYTSMFKGSSTTSIAPLDISDLNFELVTVRTSAGSYSSYAGLLFGYSKNSMDIKNVHVHDIYMNAEGTYTKTVGGFIGYAQSTSLSIKDSYIQGEIATSASTSSGTSYVGGMIGYESSSISSSIKESDTVEVNLNPSAYTTIYAGGFSGYIYTSAAGSSQFKSLIYKGKIYGSTANLTTIKTYFGGIIGYVNGSSGYYPVLTDILVTGPNNSTSDNITSAYAASSNTSYAGGIIGYSYPRTTLNNCKVLGTIGLASTSYGYAAGLIGYAYYPTTISNSAFIGAVFPAKYVRAFAGDASNSATSVTNSYAINSRIGATLPLIANTTSSTTDYTKIINSGYSSSLTGTMYFYNKSSSYVKYISSSNRLEIARYLTNFGYDKDSLSGYPIYVGEDGGRNYMIKWNEDVNGTVSTKYTAFTDLSGKIAYIYNGSEITADDLPETAYPAGYENRINDRTFHESETGYPNDLDAVYSDDETYVYKKVIGYTLVEGVDYRIEEDTVFVITKHALEDIGVIPHSIENPVYVLENDFDFSEDGSCATRVSNWDNTNAKIKGELYGADHTIKGICIFNSESYNTYIFKTIPSYVVKNINFADIHLETDVQSSYVSIFNEEYTYGITSPKSEYRNVAVDKITLKSLGDNYGYFGAILGYQQTNELTADNIKVTNAEITGLSGTDVGGVFGNIKWPKLSNVSFKGNVNVTNVGDAIGGIFGYSYSYNSNVPYLKNSSFEGNVSVQTASKIGGLIGYAASGAILENDTVTANVSESNYTGYDSYIGGVVGGSLGYISLKDIYFTGKVQIISSNGGGKIAAVIAYAPWAATFENIFVAPPSKKPSDEIVSCTALTGSCYAAGVVAYESYSSYEATVEKEVQTYKNINVLGSISANAKYNYVGGIGANVESYGMESVTYEGKLKVQSSNENDTRVGGIFAYLSAGIADMNGVFVKGITENGKNVLIDVNENSTSSQYVGGLLGWGYSKTSNFKNTVVEGNISVEAPLANSVYIGGFAGNYSISNETFSVESSSYKGSILLNNSNLGKTSSYPYAAVGGLFGFFASCQYFVIKNTFAEVPDDVASVPLLNIKRAIGNNYTGGLIGRAWVGNLAIDENSYAKGDINVESSVIENMNIGGALGFAYSYDNAQISISDFTYTGALKYSSTGLGINTVNIGGFIGLDSLHASTTITNSTATTESKLSTDKLIDVAFTGPAPQNVNAGALVGNSMNVASYDISNDVVKGVIALSNGENTLTANANGYFGTISATSNGDVKNTYYIGGVTATENVSGSLFKNTVLNMHNSYIVNNGVAVAEDLSNADNWHRYGYYGITDVEPDMARTYNGDAVITEVKKSPAFAHALGTFTYKSGANENYPYIPSATEQTTKEILYVTIVDDVADTLYRFYTNELGKAAYLPDGSPITESDMPVIEKEYGENEFSEGETDVFYLNGWKKLSLSDTYTEDVVYSMAPADLYRGHIQIVIPEDCGKIFQVGENPETYTYGQGQVDFAILGSTEAIFQGWELSMDGNVIATLNEVYSWVPDVYGEIVATALFDKTPADMLNFIESKDTNTVLYVMYNGDTLDVEDGKVTVPNLYGLELEYAIVVKDTANKTISDITIDDQNVKPVGTIYLEGDVTFNVNTKNVYHITFNDGENSVVIRVDEDEKIESGITIPAENFTYNQEKDKVTFWTGVVNETLKLWDNDTATVYNQSVSFEKQEFVADSIIGFVLPKEYIWNGSATGVFLNSNLPTIVYEDHGFYKIASSWIIAIADKSDSATINSRDEALEFMKRHYDIVADGFTFALNEKAAEDNSFKVEVNDVENIAIAGTVLDKPVEYDLLNNANTVIPRLNAPRFIGRPDEVLQITQYNDAGDSVAVLHITSGEVLTLADNVARISVKMLNHLDTYGIQNAEIALSGSAMLLNIETVDFDAQNPVELAVRLYAGDSLIVDSVITDNAEAKSYSYMRYPLLPGTYRAVVTLEGAGKPVEYKTDAFEVGSVARTIEPGSWSIVSLASTGDNFNMQNENDAAIYYWDETAPLGEFMQYNRLDHSDSIDPVAGYWYYTKTATDLTVSSIDVEDSIAWNLHNKFSGWNLVANPYAWRILVNEGDFKNPEDTSTVFWQWNAATSSYKPADTLDIYEGMWIYSDVDTMFAVSSKPVFDMPKHPGAATKYATKKTSIDSWSLRLSLVGETGVEDSWNVVGVGSQEINVLEPPSGMGDNVSLAVENGRKALAKSIKTSTRDASWNIAYKASENQTGKLYVEGLEELEELGYGATLTIDGETIVLSSETPATLKLAAFAKQAKLEVKKISEMQKIASISNLRYHVESNKMHVKFNLPTSAAGTMVNARVLDIHGKVVSYNRETGFGGENTIVLDVPKNSGIYFLNVKAGSNSKNVTIKF